MLFTTRNLKSGSSIFTFVLLKDGINFSDWFSEYISIIANTDVSYYHGFSFNDILLCLVLSASIFQFLSNISSLEGCSDITTNFWDSTNFGPMGEAIVTGTNSFIEYVSPDVITTAALGFRGIELISQIDFSALLNMKTIPVIFGGSTVISIINTLCGGGSTSCNTGQPSYMPSNLWRAMNNINLHNGARFTSDYWHTFFETSLGLINQGYNSHRGVNATSLNNEAVSNMLSSQVNRLVRLLNFHLNNLERYIASLELNSNRNLTIEETNRIFNFLGTNIHFSLLRQYDIREVYEVIRNSNILVVGNIISLDVWRYIIDSNSNTPRSIYMQLPSEFRGADIRSNAEILDRLNVEDSLNRYQALLLRLSRLISQEILLDLLNFDQNLFQEYTKRS